MLLKSAQVYCCTGWNEKFVRDYHRWILHPRFDENTCEENSFFFALYSTYPEDKTNSSFETW